LLQEVVVDPPALVERRQHLFLLRPRRVEPESVGQLHYRASIADIPKDCYAALGEGFAESIVYKQPKIAQIAPEMRFTPSLWQGNTESIRTAFIPSLKEGDFVAKVKSTSPNYSMEEKNCLMEPNPKSAKPKILTKPMSRIISKVWSAESVILSKKSARWKAST
jgi:hypothetical protein